MNKNLNTVVKGMVNKSIVTKMIQAKIKARNKVIPEITPNNKTTTYPKSRTPQIFNNNHQNQNQNRQTS
jgi:hypothetical protein